MKSCAGCGKKHGAAGAFCQGAQGRQGCKSKWHHAHKRIKEEELIVDTAGQSWWIWDKKGDVLVMGKPSKFEAIKALAFGDDDDESADDDVPATKTPAQLDREIKESLAGAKTGRHHSTIKGTAATHKRLTKTQIQKLRVELRKAIRYEKSDAVRRSSYMKHDDYERAAADAIRAAGLQGRAAAQPGDSGVEIWETIPGAGTVGDQIAEYRDRISQ